MCRGIDLADLQTAYRQFCKNATVAHSAVDLGDVIEFYDKAAANLPDHTRLKGLKLPGASTVLDRKGQPFAEVLEDDQRRIWVPLGSSGAGNGARSGACSRNRADNLDAGGERGRARLSGGCAALSVALTGTPRLPSPG
jgi:hypothetical protein